MLGTSARRAVMVGVLTLSVATSGLSPAAVASSAHRATWLVKGRLTASRRISGPRSVTASPANITEFQIPTANSAPLAITSGNADDATATSANLYFTESGASKLGLIDTSGNIQEGSLSPNSTPVGLAAPAPKPPDGSTVWFTEAVGRLGRNIPTCCIQELSIGGGTNPLSIALGPDGYFWFTEYYGNQIGRIPPTPNPTPSYFSIPTAGSQPYGITSGPDGNLWFAEQQANKIGRITPSGTITEFPITGTSGSKPTGITAGPDGNVWFAEQNGNKIGRITPSGSITEFPVLTAGSQPDFITEGSDGNLWFTELAANNIGRITPAGLVTEFQVPTPASQPAGITGGPDGNIWFTEAAGDKIGRLNLVIPPFGGPVTATDCLSPSEPHACDAQGTAGDPVNTATGYLTKRFNDFAIPGRGAPLAFTRTYNSNPVIASVDGPLGFGWAMSYGMSLTQGSNTVTIHEETGSSLAFALKNGTYEGPDRAIATLVKNGDGSYTFVRHATQIYEFNSSGQLVDEKDLNGNTTLLTYDTSGNLQTVTDPALRKLTFTWVGTHITQIADPAARTVRFGYNDGLGNLTDVTDVNAGNTHFTYDPNHLLLTMKDPRGGVATNHYDAMSQVDWQKDRLSRQTYFSYAGSPQSPMGGSTTITDPKGNVTLERYANGERTVVVRGFGTSAATTSMYHYDHVTLGATVTDANGHFSSNKYDKAGNVLSATDPLNRTTTYTYDGLNDVTSITPPTGVPTILKYDTHGNIQSSSRSTNITAYLYGDSSHPGDVTSITDPNQNKWGFGYDSYGDITSNSNPLGDTTTSVFNTVGWLTSQKTQQGHITFLDHNAFGDVTKITDPLNHKTLRGFDADRNLVKLTDPNVNITQYTYDAANELTATQQPDGTFLKTDYNLDGTVFHTYDGKGNATTYGYDSLARVTSVTDQVNHTTSYTYDGVGNRTSVLDPLGNLTQYRYDPANELILTIRADGTTNGTGYDANGNVTSQTDGLNHTTTYGYNSLHQLVRSADPLNRATTYTYDPAGNEITMLDSSNQTTTYGYDAASRPDSITYSDGTTHGVTFSYAHDGQRATMVDGSGTTRYGYDAAGRPTSVLDGANQLVSYGYDAAGNVTTLGYPGSHSVTKMFDANNRVTSVADWLGNTTKFGYDANSSLTAETLPASTGITDTYTYDLAHHLATITDAKSGTTFASFTYGRNADNLLSSAMQTGVPEPTESYAYSPLDQLKTVNANSYAYDPADNITQLTSGATLKYDAANELKSSKVGTVTMTYSYSPNGNRTKVTKGSSATTLSYDQANRLTAYGATASYAYNGVGRRVSKTVSGAITSFTWAGTLLAQAGPTSYVYGPDGLPLEQINGTTVLYYHHDQLGSTRIITDATGTVTPPAATYTYDAYGNTTASTGTITNPFQYAGQYSDAESGIQYLRARYYDPNTAQFISRDPVVATTRSAYGYVAGDPLNASDPSGLLCLEFWNKEKCSNLLTTTAVAFANSSAGERANAIIDRYSFGLSSTVEGWAGVGYDHNSANWQDAHNSFAGFLAEQVGAWTILRGLSVVGRGLSVVGRGLRALRGGETAAEEATGAATTGLRDAAESCANSFTADTPVLLADGKEKPIADVKLGDKVLATDPETGRSEARPVTALIRHSGRHTLVDLTMSDGSRITTTNHHPFWDATTRTFTDAIDLRVGDRVLSDHGRTLVITAEHVYDRTLTAYNLQIDGIHTYFAGTTPVLVHNACVSMSELPNRALRNITTDEDYALQRLELNHGVTSEEFGNQIHSIKYENGLPGDFDLGFGPTGDVWNPRTKELLGRIIHGG
jgi:RHS repeat-associated protein